MEQKTRIHADAGKQELTITREFDLPVWKYHCRIYTKRDLSSCFCR